MRKHQDLPKAFEELGLNVSLLRGLQRQDFVEPSDIQREVIPLALQGKDVLGQARTGTGKTAAFALPILQKLESEGPLQGLVLVPTRELAAQVTAEFRRLAEFTDYVITPVYGGQSIKKQVKAIGRRTHVVVATPGRALDLLKRQVIDVSTVQTVVLDEVDRMLDIGFIDDIRTLLKHFKHEHQTLFVSATLSYDVKALAKQFMVDPIEVNVSQDEITVDKIDQVYCSVEAWDKFQLLRIVLKAESPKLAIVFTNTKHNARKLAKKLHADGVNVKEIHGDLVQRKRESVMKRFRRHQIDVLVATDLAARGIDVHDVTHIINYDIPRDPQVYVHRIGRTARMGAFGRAITFVTGEEGNELTAVEMLINKQIESAQYEGFNARPPRESKPKQESAASKSRLQESVFGAGILDDQEQPKSAPQKTLGSKFRPARRRR